ncbi:MAG: hypothetical protein SF069_03740 [Phycisphaerae bacterium]|nr:hypothetical protein [Phycisphaerae bacterium]
MKIKHKLMMLALTAATFQFWGGWGCGDGGGFRNVARFLGDLIGTTIVLTGVD